MRLVVLGYLVRGPLGGMAWHHVQYLRGFARLGHDVAFVEDSDDYPSCYDPVRDVTDADPSYGLNFADQVLRRLGFGERWAFFDAHANRWHGPLGPRARRLCAAAEVVVNVSGVNPLRPWLENVPARVLIDTDPAFTQIRHLTEPSARGRATGHTAYFTFGERIGAGAEVPDDGFPWLPTRQPIVLEDWPVSPGPPTGRYTTVMTWDAYEAREHAGVRYGMKSASFGPYLGLPRLVDDRLEVAVGSPTAPRRELRRHGWRVVDPRRPARDPFTYQRYIRSSKGEFSVAKHGYVASGSGWFSERSACYLASGRPVITQDTGFGDFLPTGEGLLVFASPEEAQAAFAHVASDYAAHCRAAREIAEGYFSAETVLTSLLERL